MTQTEEIKQLKERVGALESLMVEVKQTLGIGRVDEEALQTAINQMLDHRDTSALDNYLKRGGKIPIVSCGEKSQQRIGGMNG